MAFIITEPCIGTCDTSCVSVCPVDCIHGPIPLEELQERVAAGELEQLTLERVMMYIDPDICIDCGACEPECPVDAIFEEFDVPEKWNHYIELNAEFFQK